MPLFRHRISGPGSAGDTWTTGLHTESSDSIDAAHAAWNTFITDFVDGVLADFWKTTTSAASVTTDALSFDGLHAVDQRSSAHVVAGSQTGAGTSPRACLVVGLKTSVPQRSGRGRMFWPGLDGGHYTASGLFTTAAITAIADGMDSALTTLQDVQQPVILHRGAPGVGYDVDNIVTVKIGNIPGTQRRRTNKIVNAYESRGL